MIKYAHNENLVITDYVKNNILGKTFKTKKHGYLKVIGVYDYYQNNKNKLLRYICKFENTGYERLAFATAIKNGNVKDKYSKILCSVGYVGEYKGDYSKHFLFIHWQGMIERCYNEKYTCYRENGEVDERWHSFSNFIEDCENLLGYNEMIEHSNVKFTIDKDYIKEGNQIYSKDNCCFLPQTLNAFILNQNKKRDYNYEGIYLRSDSLKFRASIRFQGKTKNIMQSDNPEIVHDAYWDEKLNIAKIYFENEFSYLSDKLKKIIYDRIELKYNMSKKELKRAIEDNYFNNIIKEKRK